MPDPPLVKVTEVYVLEEDRNTIRRAAALAGKPVKYWIADLAARAAKEEIARWIRQPNPPEEEK
jgi:hypothetical protein